MLITLPSQPQIKQSSVIKTPKEKNCNLPNLPINVQINLKTVIKTWKEQFNSFKNGSKNLIPPTCSKDKKKKNFAPEQCKENIPENNGTQETPRN